MNQSTLLSPKFLKISKSSFGSLLRNRAGGIVVGIISALAMVAPATAQIHQLNRDETALFKRIAADSGQMRNTVRLDPILCIVARDRAADMAKRDYFSHTNPDGHGVNFLVRRAGYVLPSYYDRSPSGNNLESIGMSTGRPQEMVSLWSKSSGHRVHVLGEVPFYRQQSSVGVGVFRSPKAPHYKYYVFLSAPPNGSLSPRSAILKNPKGVTIASTRPLGGALAPFGMATN